MMTAAALDTRTTRRFEQLMMPHKTSLYSAALSLTHSAPDAEDLVQETMIRAFNRFDTFRSDGSPKAWLHTILRNLFFNLYRKRSREPRQVSLDYVEPTTNAVFGTTLGIGAGATTAQQKAITSPERLVLGQMEGDALLSAVRNLPDDYRRVVVLADLQGLPYQEIADSLGVPIGTVRSRLSRGRERVRRALFAWRPSGDAPHAIAA